VPKSQCACGRVRHLKKARARHSSRSPADRRAPRRILEPAAGRVVSVWHRSSSNSSSPLGVRELRSQGGERGRPSSTARVTPKKRAMKSELEDEDLQPAEMREAAALKKIAKRLGPRRMAKLRAELRTSQREPTVRETGPNRPLAAGSRAAYARVSRG
jgi:hypothetical protein